MDLLEESPDCARIRETQEFARILNRRRGQVVLYGAGSLGSKVARAVAASGGKLLAFADRNPALNGTTLDGVPVFSVEEAVRRHARQALFIVTIFRGSGDEGMASRLALLRDFGCDVVSFLPACWAYEELTLPHYGVAKPSQILSAADALRRVASIWADDLSARTFTVELAWRLTADFTGVEPRGEQYQPRDIYRLRNDERFVDGGAFDGDTLRALRGRYSQAWAIEPDPANAERLRRMGNDRVVVIECALGSRSGTASFLATGGVDSSLSPKGRLTVAVRALDDLELKRPTFLKLDIEGAELEAVKGGARMLGRAQPIVAVCLYHHPEHLWEIPLLLRDILPAHQFYLRRHEHDGFELVCYAVPKSRSI